MSNVTIRDIKVINTCPTGQNLTVVKIETSEPGLYGLGCSTFTYRYKSVTSVVLDYFKPLLIGRDVANIEDIWNLVYGNSYWRNGPIMLNALSGVDMALWDIKGKMAKMPLYDLLGGKSREGAAVYRHIDGKSYEEVLEKVLKFHEQGVNYVRVQFGGYGGSPESVKAPNGAQPGVYYSPDKYFRETVGLIEYVSDHLNGEVRLMHDTHERLAPIEAVRLAKELEPFGLFFLEDVLPPEQGEWFKMIRSQCSTPIAMGELFTDFKQYDYLVSNRLIDFVRSHISAMGGITPARKLAVMAEMFGIRTAWHGPLDVSPVGFAANIHLDVSSHNFGIQEWAGPDEKEILCEMFPGLPKCVNGYVYPNENPGLGIDIDEELAAKFPCNDDVTKWTQTRISDGTYNVP